MNKKLKLYIFLGIIFVSITGTLSHFFYEWSGYNKIIALFSPVNESTWEHIKLLFFPMLIYTIFISIKLRSEYPCILSAMLFGNILGCILIPVIFYTYTGILGFNLTFLDIADFYISVIISFFTACRLSISCKYQKYAPALKFIIIILAVMFIAFTISPPNIALFKSP